MFEASRLICCIALHIGLLGCTWCDAQDDNTGHHPSMPADGIGFINDVAATQQAERQVNRMIKDDEATLCRDLFAQLDRTVCQLELPPVVKRARHLPKLYVDACQSIVVILISRKHNDHWHVTPAATGFVVGSEVIATNFHVIPDNDEYLFVMTSDGGVHPVTEVLAGNKANDVVLARAAVDGVDPLPLREELPVGSLIRVISHPKGRYYSLSQGVVSRRYERPVGKRRPQDDQPDGDDNAEVVEATRWVTVTADFGGGSSGAPVLDRSGNVIAMATSTNGVEAGEGERKTVQMVFRDCAPAEVILELIEKPDPVTDRVANP